jgi:hypothetical protein
MVLPLMVTLGGCSLFRSPETGRAVLQAGRGAEHFVPAGEDLSRNVRPLSEAARDLAAAPTPTPGRAVPQVRRGLVEIYTADEAVESEYRKLLVDAFCLGMDQLAARDEDTRVEQEEWKSYLLAYFDRFGPNAISDYARDYAEKKIDEFLTAMNLAGVSPRAARAYVQHCVSFSP